MKLHKKVSAWLSDYTYMFRGAGAGLIYHRPPKHYLDYTIDGKVPVILIPGILGKWSFMKSLGDKISKHGHPVYIVPELGYNVFSIPSSARIIRTSIKHIFPKQGHIVPKLGKGSVAIQKVIDDNKLKGVVFVAHSKGGLIGKYFLSHYDSEHKVLGMVAIATPFSGSAMAKLLPFDPIKELDNDSKLIHDLEKHQEINSKIISIRPEYDNHVWAEKGSFLEGAENIEVAVQGHHKVIFDTNVQKIVLEAIEKITLRR